MWQYSEQVMKKVHDAISSLLFRSSIDTKSHHAPFSMVHGLSGLAGAWNQNRHCQAGELEDIKEHPFSNVLCKV